MNTQNNLVTRWLSRFFLGSFLLATLLLVSCGDDPEPANEEELITTLTVTLTPTGGAPITMTFKDLDGEGAGVPEYIYSSGGDAAVLSASTTYTAEITLLNESVTPAENITEEVEEEADEHLFCFDKTGLTGLTITYADTEADYIAGGSTKVVGLATTWTTTTTGEGTVTIILRHQPGTKTGDCPGPGETDIEVTFNIAIQ
ncbi:MAG: hypothetical protein KF803_06115 [Cyclobacteriaceae bacterium]|nr:hypothetical protein [Cyclobacteriaceae bacterium]